jgi:hypothetical protein
MFAEILWIWSEMAGTRLAKYVPCKANHARQYTSSWGDEWRVQGYGPEHGKALLRKEEQFRNTPTHTAIQPDLNNHKK